MMNNLLNNLKVAGLSYSPKTITESNLEVPFSEFVCFVVIVNNQYKVFTYNKNNNIIDESKWYKRSKYIVNYIKKYATNYYKNM